MRKLILLVIIFLTYSTVFISTAFADNQKVMPSIESEAAIIIDASNGSILYEKNADKKMYPASLTKIATAIYAIETASNLKESVIVSDNARNVDGTRVYLEPGEEVSLKKILQGLLINSGNDAGVAIAEHLHGSVEKFAKEINKYLHNVIGVKDTHFKNPHGLFDEEHVTTAKDLATITQYAIENRDFLKIFGTKELKWDGKAWDTTLYSHHKLMREMPYEGVIGGKTGFVSESGFTLATFAMKNRMRLVVVTLNSNLQSIAYNDTVSLLDYGFENFITSSLPKETAYKNGSKAYKTSAELSYTHLKGEDVNQEVTKDGVLEISNEQGSVINTFPLVEIKETISDNAQKKRNREITMTTTEDYNQITKTDGKDIYSWVYAIFFIALLLTVTIIMKKRLN